MEETIGSRCLDCSKPLPPGRTDKRYCDDICRARATRKRNRENAMSGYEDGHTAVIRAIKKNHALLKKAVGDRDEWTVDLYSLLLRGFTRQFYTSAEIIENDRLRYYCFELGWEDIGDEKISVTTNIHKLRVAPEVSKAGTDTINFSDIEQGDKG